MSAVPCMYLSGASGEETTVFTASSRLALAMPESYWERRFGLALLLMHSGINMLPPEQRISFTYNYSLYWSGGRQPRNPANSRGRANCRTTSC